MGKMTVVAPCLYTVGTLNRLTDEVNNIDQLVILQCSNWVMKFMLMQVDTLSNTARDQVHLLIATTLLSHIGHNMLCHTVKTSLE